MGADADADVKEADEDVDAADADVEAVNEAVVVVESDAERLTPKFIGEEGRKIPLGFPAHTLDLGSVVIRAEVVEVMEARK